MRVRLVAALTDDHAIGAGGTLPWRLPGDLARFKALTTGGTVVMGRRTAESIGRALPGRRNLVLSRAGAAPYPDQEVVRTPEQALATTDDLFVLGGGEIYALFLPLATDAHLTWVDAKIPDADTFFPPVSWDEWTEVARSAHAPDERHRYGYAFVDYTRTPSVG